MKLEKVIQKCSAPLAHEQLREIRGRLKFAGVDVEDVQKDEYDLVRDVVAAVAQAAPMERRASFHGSMGGCPRCGQPVTAVKLAGNEGAAYCGSCRVVVPG